MYQIEEDDDLRELGSPLRNETPSEWEWMDPICVRKFLSFLFINRQTLAQTIFLTLAPLDEAHPLKIFFKCSNGKCITIKVDSFDNSVGFVEDAIEAVV